MRKSFKKLSIIFICVSLILGNMLPVFASTLSDIRYIFEPKIVRIYNDENLKTYLNYTKRGSNIIAKEVKNKYYDTYKKELDITEPSIAVEIIGHVFPDKVARYLPKFIKDSILSHTEIIDIGEKSVDSNRWVWDSIAKVLSYNSISNSQGITKRFSTEKLTIEEQINDIIVNNYENLNLDRDIMRLVLEDIQNGDIDPILLDISN